MEKYTCKLCFRRFSSGRALGGHMRSHLATAAAAAAASAKGLIADHGSFSTSYREEEEAKGMCSGLHENPKESSLLVGPKFSSDFEALDGGSSTVVQDRESETDSSPLAATPAGIYRRSSKRRRRLTPTSPLSSVYDTTAEEDVALCLMMLSRDVWTKDEDERGEEAQRPASKGRSRFQCWTCNRVFRSYQALGGHRASHKKLKGCAPAAASSEASGDVGDVSAEEKGLHECPVCFRVFTSGQALGGHRRSHLCSSATTIASPVTAKLGNCLLDLNLPAPMDEDAELSAVSDPDFIDLPTPNQ